MLVTFVILILLAVANVAPFVREGKEVLSNHPRSRARRHLAELLIPEATTDVSGLTTTEGPKENCSTADDETKFGDTFTLECAEQQIFSSVKSSYCSSLSDRAWTFRCKGVRGEDKLLDECFWSPFINDFGGFISFQCPFNSLVTGFYSTFRADRKDRRWKVKCCTPGSYLVYNCLTTLPANEWNDVMDFSSPSAYYMRGIRSDVSAGKRDRRYQFDLCKLKKPVTQNLYG
ncbi:dermatopontin-like [Branchiostoma floridae x Branchiostoma belcheri]